MGPPSPIAEDEPHNASGFLVLSGGMSRFPGALVLRARVDGFGKSESLTQQTASEKESPSGNSHPPPLLHASLTDRLRRGNSSVRQARWQSMGQAALWPEERKREPEKMVHRACGGWREDNSQATKGTPLCTLARVGSALEGRLL